MAERKQHAPVFACKIQRLQTGIEDFIDLLFSDIRTQATVA